MNDVKVLVICEMIYNNIEEECKKSDSTFGNYKQVGKWFFIGGETDHSKFQTYLTFAKKNNIGVIIIHKGVEDKNYEELCNVAKKEAQIEILGFHTTEIEITEKIKTGDYSVIEELKKNKIKRDIALLSHYIVHLFLPLDIDLMGICEVLKEDFKPPEGKNKEEWAKEYYDEAFKDASPKYKFEELCNQVKAEVENTELDNDKKGKILQMFNYDDMDWNLPSGFKIDEFQQLAEKNPFHQWFCGVMKELEKMREESFELFGERSEIFKKLVDKLS